MPNGKEPKVKSPCRGECLKEEWDARNVSIDSVSKSPATCPDLTDAEKTNVKGDIKSQLKGEIVLTECPRKTSRDCECVWSEPPPRPATYVQYGFEWTVKKPHPTQPRQTCKYTIKGKVEIATRLIRGICMPIASYEFKGTTELGG